MKISNTEVQWQEVKNNARVTVGLKESSKEIPFSWKKQILLAEHSPIRTLRYNHTWFDIPYWVSVHFVRHWLGILHYVKTSRTDRTGIERTKLPQDNPVNHKIEANAQALINISRKRLCTKASEETRNRWKELKEYINFIDPVVSTVMVRECIYRGFCPEFDSCGYTETELYKTQIKAYREVI